MNTIYLLFSDAADGENTQQRVVDSPVFFTPGDRITVEGAREYEVDSVFWWVRTKPGVPGYNTVCQHVLLK